MYESDISVSFARGAFGGVSFNPERRGDSFIREYSQTLAEDYETLKKHATKGGTLDSLESEFARYRAGFRKVNSAYLASTSRCVSSFIAGPSNFPAARMNKRADIAHKRLNELFGFRERALNAAIRNLRPDMRPIMAGDANALERLAEKLQKAEMRQAIMKRTNATIRKYKKDGEAAQIDALMALGYQEGVARELLKPDYCGRIGYADYQLTNNGAEIRHMEKRIESLSVAKETPVSTEERENGVTVEDDPPANRIRVFFPGKPDSTVRDALKSRGFRWSPTIGAWQAYRNYSALEFAKTL